MIPGLDYAAHGGKHPHLNSPNVYSMVNTACNANEDTGFTCMAGNVGRYPACNMCAPLVVLCIHAPSSHVSSCRSVNISRMQMCIVATTVQDHSRCHRKYADECFHTATRVVRCLSALRHLQYSSGCPCA